MLIGVLTYVWQAQAQQSISPMWTLVIAALGIASAVITSAWVSSNAAQRFQGSMEALVKTKFEQFDLDVKRLNEVDRDQWKEFGKVEERIVTLRERVTVVETRCGDKPRHP